MTKKIVWQFCNPCFVITTVWYLLRIKGEKTLNAKMKSLPSYWDIFSADKVFLFCRLAVQNRTLLLRIMSMVKFPGFYGLQICVCFTKKGLVKHFKVSEQVAYICSSRHGEPSPSLRHLAFVWRSRRCDVALSDSVLSVSLPSIVNLCFASATSSSPAFCD